MIKQNDSSYVHSMTAYSNLESYNKSTTMSFLRYKNVPSSKFPVLPVVETKMSNNVLTYDTDMNYPTVKKAYGSIKEPTYYIGKCPSNQFVRDFHTTTPSPSPI